ncbi:hypothetical protein BDV93DRAFT_369375 [Ceratobasidium sp. AG-I]|nr:hypothetical protein BDV93DRAFT_369375 [Ceratobasidium sp. AG-I]
MSLPGANVDKDSMHGGFLKIFDGIQVETVEGASSSDIHKGMTTVNDPTPASCWFYLQGHGRPWMYLPSDSHNDSGAWEGLSADDICSILGVMDRSIWRIFVTDFCYSGNYFRLQYMLLIDETGAQWVETPEWSTHRSECAEFEAHGTPALHLAGSTVEEEVFEGRRSGGFFTKALVENCDRPMALPDLLRAIRVAVNVYLAKAKSDCERFPKDAKQTPQIFSSMKWSLEDIHILAKFHQADSESLDIHYDGATTSM